jgi:hypothetical protein
MLSLIYPICDRTALFATTLQTLTVQTLPPDEFEVLVVDDGGTDPDLLLLLSTAVSHGLRIRYFRIDIHKVPFPLYQFEGRFNDPGPALNVALRRAEGDRVVISHPEIYHCYRSNLDQMASWPLGPKDALICDVYDPSMADDPILKGMIGGGPGQRPLHFLGVYPKEFFCAIGGYEEEFVKGWGYQDTELVSRWQKSGGRFLFSGDRILGIHQPHPRVEHITQDGLPPAKALYEKLSQDPTFLVANVGREWGSDALILEDRWI